MAAITDPRQRTVDAIYRQYEARQGNGFRPHLGASLIGHPCRRYLWLMFRWARAASFSGRMLRLFQRGQLEEQVFVSDLRAAGVEVWEVDPATGQQFRVESFGGHFSGSLDGVALGLLEAPATAHLLEFKTHNTKSFATLVKNGVQKAKPQHYAQMQTYMGRMGLTRAYYMAVNKDTDEIYAERIRFDRAAFDAIMDKAEAVIFAPEPLERISNDPSWYQCKTCDMYEICHGQDVPAVNCRTCAHATPQRDGTWLCERHNKILSTEDQQHACQAHRFIPALLSHIASVEDASQEDNWVRYKRHADGAQFTNGQPPTGLLSEEIASCNSETTNRSR